MVEERFVGLIEGWRFLAWGGSSHRVKPSVGNLSTYFHHKLRNLGGTTIGLHLGSNTYKKAIDLPILFRAPPPIPKLIDTSHAIDELPSYDSFEPAPDDF